MSSPRGDDPVEQFGPYEVYEQLGMGGMATVHRAKKQGIEGFQRVVALKRLLPHLADDESFIKSFVREARLASYLQHANIIQIYDLGRVEESYYIAMELVHGRDLRQMLKQTAYTTGPMPVAMAVTLLLQLCDALEYAHTRSDDDGEPLGIVHRDISPSNLLLSTEGYLKIIDFGIAKATTTSLRTQTGRVKGKFAYMAPEVINGKPLDHRSDIFAAGIVAHEMLTAQPLFAGRNEYETLRKISKMPLVPPSHFNPDCPPDLDEIVMTALARSPEERWQSAGAMMRALEHVAKKLALRATNREIAEWVEWAFTQTPQDEGGSPAHDSTAEVSQPALRSSMVTLDTRTIDRASVEVVWGSRMDDGDAEPGDAPADSGLPRPEGVVRSWASPQAIAGQTSHPLVAMAKQALGGDASPGRGPGKGSTLFGVAPPPSVRAQAAARDGVPAPAPAQDSRPTRAPGSTRERDGVPAPAPAQDSRPTRAPWPASEPPRPATVRTSSERSGLPPLFWIGVLVLLSAGGAAAGYFLVPSNLFGDDAPLGVPTAPPERTPPAEPPERTPPAEPPPTEPPPTEPRSIDGAAVRRVAGEPLRAQDTGEHQVVRGRLCIDEHGAVTSVEITDAPEPIAAHARSVLSTWRYEPYLDSGAPAPACFLVEVEAHD